MGWRDAVGGFVLRMLGNPAAEGRASLENPSTSLSDPADWLYETLGGRKARTGVKVSRETALTYAAVWRSVSLISGTVGKLPLLTYKRNGEGKDRAPEHPSYSLLRYKPNPYMTAFVWKQVKIAHVLLRGNGYSYVFRRGDASAEELLPLNPESTYPVRENGVLMYVTAIPTSSGPGGAGATQLRKLPAADVLHIKGLGFDGLVGYDVITKARESLGLGMGMEEYGSRFFRNNARPSVIIEHPGVLKEPAAKRLREQWNAMHSGLENSHKTAVLEENMKLKEFSVTARNAQLIESRTFELRQVANWFGVPPHKVGDTTRTAFASLEQENQSFLDDGIDPWLVLLEEECRDKLLTEDEKRKDSHVIEFMRQALVRADLAARADYYGRSLGGRPWMTTDEVRGRENLNPLGGDAAKLLDPLNMAVSGQKPKNPSKQSDVPADPKPDEDDESAD